MPTEKITLDGHIINSLLLSKVLDIIDDNGGTHYIEQIAIGHTREEPSHALIRIMAGDDATLKAIVDETTEHGASRIAS